VYGAVRCLNCGIYASGAGQGIGAASDAIERRVAVLWHTSVSAGIDPYEARNCLMRAEVVEMVVEQKAS